jgi:hypothetical protein
MIIEKLASPGGLLALFAVLVLSLACAGGSDNGGSGAANNASPPRGEGRLVVADTSAEVVYVYDSPSFAKVAEFPGIKLSSHLGAISLPDGRAVFVDDKSSQVIVLQTMGERPEILQRVSAASPAIWGGIDPDFEYLVYSSPPDDSPEKVATATLVNLKDYKAHELKVPMGGTGELHVALGGKPLTLFASTLNEIHAYRVSDVVKGEPVSLGFTEVNPSLHGAVITYGSKPRILVSTTASFDLMTYNGSELGAAKGLAWDVDGRTGGRNGRPRLSWDGNYVYGTLAAAVPADQWQTRQNDVHIVNLQNESVKRMQLAPGIVGRFQLSKPFALFYNIHPDGDFALLLDTDPSSATFQQLVGRIPLQPLAGAPRPGVSAAGTEARNGAITPDGKYAFISQGGESKIWVIDTESRTVVKDIAVPTALRGGGYMLAVQKDVKPVDLQVR